MHIPRQSDGSSAHRTVRAAGADELRARRRHLVGQLRTVGYWQRLVQARTDLSVAGLLYAAPVPTAVQPHPPGWSVGTDGEPGDLSGLASPPDGVDVGRLLGSGGLDAPGVHLDRLREIALVLVRRSRALQEELDVVTSALHARLAQDGTDDPADDRTDEQAALA